MDVIDKILRGNDLVAVLGRDVTVWLVDISICGCLLESNSQVAEGTAGSLKVTFGGHEYADAIRVNRCQEIPGSPRYRLGAEFLWTTRPGRYSLRQLIVNFKNVAAHNGSSVYQDRV